MQRRQFTQSLTTSVASSAAVLSGATLVPSVIQAKPEWGALEAMVRNSVDQVMSEFDVPGVALGVTHRGHRRYFSFGTADKAKGPQVTEHTLFEVGSISKVFTATLGAQAQAVGALKLSDKASQHMAALRGSAFDSVSLVDLATYTAGGLPLQFPSGVSDANVLEYFRRWKPSYAAGTTRVYSNPSIGLYGRIAAQALNAPFSDAVERLVLHPLGLRNTFLRVPTSRMSDYAWGYESGNPIRVGRGVMDLEAYGIKTSTTDLLRFLELSMDPASLTPELRTAIRETQQSHHRVGETEQALVWESYAFPAALETLRVGNSDELSHRPRSIQPVPSRGSRATPVLLNKTGGTNGFCAYVLIVPSERIGVVILGNKGFPRADRVQVAHRVVTALTQHTI